MDYATVTDIIKLKRPLSIDEQTRAAALITEISNAIRFEAQKVGKNFDEMVFASELGSQVDLFKGDGETTEFVLSDTPASPVTVMIGNEVCSAYILDGDNIIFEEAPENDVEILISYKYRILLHIAKIVTVDVVMRELNTPGAQLPTVSYSESAGGLSQSYALPNASGRIALWPSDLKTLGLKRQVIGMIDLMRR